MQPLLDHLFATIAGGLLLLSVLLLQAERGEEVRDSTRYYSAKNFQTALADMLQRDLLNLGTNLPAGQPMITEIRSDRVTFYTAVNGTGNAVLVTYQEVAVGTTTNGDTVYEIRRYVNGRHTGTGLLVTRFDLAFADENGVPVSIADAFNARIATVQVENLLPYEARDVNGNMHISTPHRNYWEISYTPPNLAHGW
jgi:hypothetical protein